MEQDGKNPAIGPSLQTAEKLGEEAADTRAINLQAIL
jgi:hypothetical protein